MNDDHSTATAVEGYEGYFGLTESPFKLTSSPRFLYESTSYLAAFKEIGYALSRREQIIVVTGPIGTGKTTLCRMLKERHDGRTLVATLNTPPRSVDDLFRQVLDGFDLLTEDTKSIVGASRYGLQRVFRQFLDSLVALNAQAILVFDEAQHLGPDILEEIRLLLNLDPDRQLLQIVLVGQPELDDVLARTELGQMAQRISRRHHLEPLQLAEVSAYIDRRLSVARTEKLSGDRPTFTDPAVQAIATLSRGVPRVVNIICDRALENAWFDKTHVVDAATVVGAARTLKIEVPAALAATPAALPSVRSETRQPSPLPIAPPPIVAPPPMAPRPMAPQSISQPFVAAPSATTTAPYTAGVPTSASVRVTRSHVPVTVVSIFAGFALLIWIIIRGGITLGNRNPTLHPEGVRETGRSGVPGTPGPAPPSATATARPVESSPERASSANQFLIVVSSFRTRERAAQVAADIVALGLPASVRTASGWEQVVVGPYSSRQDAVTAQNRLGSAHFTDTNLTQTTPQ